MSSCSRECTAPFLFGLFQKLWCTLCLRRVGWQEAAACAYVPHVVPAMEGGIAPSPGIPVLGLEMLPQSRAGLPESCSRLHSLQRRLVGGNYTAQWKKNGVEYFRDHLDTAWSFLIRETNDICCAEKSRGRLHRFLASYNDVARLPPIFCSALIFYTILFKSCGS